MTPKMTPERKQELMASSLAFCPNPADEVGSEDFYSHVTRQKIQPLTHGELRELLTQKVCEWTRVLGGYTRLCSSHPEVNAYVEKLTTYCDRCGGKVTVTR